MRRSSAALALALLATACAATVPNRVPVGEPFPAVEGKGLDGTPWRLPSGLDGPTVLLVGYVQDTQFDLDRWLLGLHQLSTPIDRYEVPAVRSGIAALIASRIDEGMRSGIPSSDWGAVITVYDDAEPIVQLTGNERPRNARVLLLDREGVVRWFHDGGFSVGALVALDATARALNGTRTATTP